MQLQRIYDPLWPDCRPNKALLSHRQSDKWRYFSTTTHRPKAFQRWPKSHNRSAPHTEAGKQPIIGCSFFRLPRFSDVGGTSYAVICYLFYFVLYPTIKSNTRPCLFVRSPSQMNKWVTLLGFSRYFPTEWGLTKRKLMYRQTKICWICQSSVISCIDGCF